MFLRNRRYNTHIILVVITVIVSFTITLPRLTSIMLSNAAYVILNKSSDKVGGLSQDAYVSLTSLWSNAIQLAPKNLSSYRGLGYIYAFQGENVKARRYWLMGKVEPVLILAHARQLSEKQQCENGVAWLQDYLALSPSREGFYYLGQCYEQLQSWDQALEAYNEGLSLPDRGTVGKSRLYYRLAIIYEHQVDPPRPDLASIYFYNALETNDFGPLQEKGDSHCQLAVIGSQLGQDPLWVLEEYEKALQVFPEHYWCRTLYGYQIFLVQGDIQASVHQIEDSLQIWPEGPSRKWPYIYLARIYLASKRYNEARYAAERALFYDPQDVQVQSLVAEIIDHHDVFQKTR